MAWYRNLRMTPKIVLPVGMMLIVALGLLTWQIQSRSSTAMRAAAERELAALAGEKGNAVKSIFEVALNETQSLASAVSTSMEAGLTPSREQLIAMLQGLQKANPQFMGAGSAWEPNAYDGNDAQYKNAPGHTPQGRFQPYQAKGVPLEPLLDLETSNYYADPKRLKASVLTEPYEYEVDGKKVLMLTASAVIKQKNEFKGIVLVDLSLESVAAIVRDVRVFTSGRGCVLTQDGDIVAHPDPSMVTKNLIDLGMVANANAMRAAMKAGKPYTEIYRSKGITDNIYYYYPIYFEDTGQTWYFGVAAPLHEVMADADEISLVTLIASGITLLLSLLIIFVVVRSSLKPLAVLAGSAHEIAEGNLKVTIDDASFGGEMLELSTSLKNMITSLVDLIAKAEAMSEDAKAQTVKAQEAMREAEQARLAAENAKREGMLQAAGQLEGVVNIISSASEELSAQVEQSERGSSEQAARMAETATAMEEMNSTVLEVASNAGSASELSAETRAKAEQGAQIVRGTVESIRNVQEVSLKLKDDMTTLSQQAEAISTIMGVISDIADQTNLLALNAAIEAARAGEAGRGFAVVADEVRKLAEKTMLSTKDVGDAITSVQSSVRQSIGQVDKAVELISEATDGAGNSGSALEEIVHMVDNVADQMRAIAAASEEQSSTSEEINRSIGEVNSIAEQTAQAMQEAAQAVSDLAAQAHALNNLIENMKNS